MRQKAGDRVGAAQARRNASAARLAYALRPTGQPVKFPRYATEGAIRERANLARAAEVKASVGEAPGA